MAKDWHQRQKARGIKLILTWFGARNRWKKFRDGHTKYFTHPNSAAGYEAAVAEYHAWLHEMKDSRTLAAEYQHHIGQLRMCLEWYVRFGVPEEEDQLQPEVEKLKDRFEATLESKNELQCPSRLLPDGAELAERELILSICNLDGLASEKFGSIGWSPNGVWTERLRQLSELDTHHRKQPQTVQHQVQRFLAFKEKQVNAGIIKARTWGTLSERLQFFVDWIKPGTHVSTIDGTTITNYYEWVLSHPSWGHQRAKGIFNTGRQWIRWAFRQDDVELEQLPRNIDSREFVFLTHIDETGVTKETRTDKLWTPRDFALVSSQVPVDFRLFLLLMLNCGFTNEDVAALLKSEIRLSEGRIVRQRGKTRRHAHPPVVSYKLWSTTIKLLEQQWSDHPTLALTNQRGNPLAVSKLVHENGETKEVVWTSIGRRFGQMKNAKAQLPNKQLMFLRKSGSTKIRSKREFMSLDSLYLGHSWATVADKHYNAFDGQPYDPLDEALRWLGEEFGQV